MNEFLTIQSDLDFNKKNTDIISDSNAKYCYFFYINNISHNFDIDLQDYHFDEDDSLNKEDIQEIKQFSNITKSSIVIKIINSVFNRIAMLTTSKNVSLFKNLSKDNEPFYITYDKNNDFSNSILGNIHTNKMYSFVAYINESSYLYRFADKLNIMFYLQQDTNRLVGGFALNKLDTDSNNFNDTLDDYYVSNLINNFIIDQLYPFDLELLLDINKKGFNPNNKNASNTQTVNISNIEKLTMDNKNLNLLKSNWEKLITNKFIKYKLDTLSQEDIKYYKETLFYSIMSTWMIIIQLVEELDEYFTSGNEQKLIASSNKKQEIINAVNLTDTEDFLSIANYLKVTKTADIMASKFDNYSLSEPTLLYDVYTEDNIYLLDINQILKNRILTSFLMLILFKSEYGINDINANFLNINQLKKLVFEDVKNGFSSDKIQNFKQTISTQNFDYVSFVNSEQIVLLHNPATDKNKEYKKIVNYYIWALVFVVSKRLEMNDLQSHTNYIMISNQKAKVIFFRQIIRDIEDIKFNWDDDFFGIKQIKNIVFTMNKQMQIMQDLNKLMDHVKNEDEIFKRQTERTSIILSFIVALLIGYVDFLACVFSILPCSWTVVTWNWILGTIGFTTFTTTINLIILVLTIIYLGWIKSHYKNIDTRAKRIRYSKDKLPQYVSTTSK